MQEVERSRSGSPSIVKRGLAVVVLVIAAYILLKLVIGIVRPDKANDVLEALYRAEVRGFSLSRVQGHGGELERVETYRGTRVKMGLAEKVRFEIAVSDAFVEATIDALCEGGRTGDVGDGKIFVVPLERVVRIRTAETDDSAVTPVKA